MEMQLIDGFIKHTTTSTFWPILEELLLKTTFFTCQQAVVETCIIQTHSNCTYYHIGLHDIGILVLCTTRQAYWQPKNSQTLIAQLQEVIWACIIDQLYCTPPGSHGGRHHIGRFYCTPPDCHINLYDISKHLLHTTRNLYWPAQYRLILQHRTR